MRKRGQYLRFAVGRVRRHRVSGVESAPYAAFREKATRNPASVEKQMSRVLNYSLIAVAMMLMAGSASAHHSHAMFDTDKQVTLVGTVKQFQWNNPHCWIQVLVPDPKDPSAAPVEWGVEMGAPIQLIRHGWKPDSLKPGDRITVVVNPLRDGRPGGQIVSAIGPDGKPIGAVPDANSR
jgi:Family of unknown function (DUF6152)